MAEIPLIRVCTAGSVDDGKSTLIGRLLVDCRAVFRDQLEHVEEASRRRGFHRTELALLTDGLRAEREQGITIDVAWRYFSTPRARFVLADAPGHVQYTRNMVTGASAVDVVVLLVDARRGLAEQTRRHATIAQLLGVPHQIFAINKMDEVDYDGARFAELVAELDAYLPAPRGQRHFVPVSALVGDNVVEHSPRMPFYDGPTLVELLEAVRPLADRGSQHFVFSVQWVIRANDTSSGRSYAGVVTTGAARIGDELTVLPSGATSRIARIDVGLASVDGVSSGQVATLHLADEVDVSRGDLFHSRADAAQARIDRDLTAELCWFSTQPLRVGAPVLLKHQQRVSRAVVSEIESQVDIRDGRHVPATSAHQNDIVRVRIRTAQPVVWEPYADNRRLGSFILIDPNVAETLAAGLLT